MTTTKLFSKIQSDVLMSNIFEIISLSRHIFIKDNLTQCNCHNVVCTVNC